MKRILFAAAALMALGLPGLALAQATTNLTVQASVSAVCTVTASPLLDFNAYDPVSANASTALTGSGLISVTCTKNTSTARIDLDNGANFSGTRRMLNQSAAGEFLNYNLFKPSAAGSGATCTASAWGTGATNGYSPVAGDFTSASTAVDFKVCGSVPAGQNVATGTYKDTVGVTVNF